LKSTSGWNNDGNGSDSYGFAALPGGYGSSDGRRFGDAGNDGYWWSASEVLPDFAYLRNVYYKVEFAYWGDYGKSFFYSVRCVQD
jgi:uncharacterized protein (TIGR02145 family)